MNGKAKKAIELLGGTSKRHKRMWNMLSHVQKGRIRTGLVALVKRAGKAEAKKLLAARASMLSEAEKFLKTQ